MNNTNAVIDLVVIDLIRRSLESGEAVEIEGLGTFRKTRHGIELHTASQPRVFVAYVLEDLAIARRICEELTKQGCAPWLDRDELLPGQNWPRAIKRAIADSDAFVACFSTRAIAKKGQFQAELRLALDCAHRFPLDATFLIPARLDDCAVPTRVAEHLQYVDLFPDWNQGIKRLVRSIRKAVRQTRRAQPRLV
jgi:hypothetical protein